MNESKALKPIEMKNDFLKKIVPELMKAAPKGFSAERLIRVTLNAMQKNPLILECTNTSLFLALMDSATFGLLPDSISNEAHLIPFRDNKNNCVNVVFMPGYNGLIKMAFQTGYVSDVDVVPVYTEDEFYYCYGLQPQLIHKPPMEGDRGDFKGAYAIVRLQSGVDKFIYVSREEALAHGERFSKSKDKKTKKLFGTWHTDFEAMNMKTAVRKVMKYVPKSPLVKLGEAIAKDEMLETKGFWDDSPIAEPESTEPPIDIPLETEPDDGKEAPDGFINQKALEVLRGIIAKRKIPPILFAEHIKKKYSIETDSEIPADKTKEILEWSECWVEVVEEKKEMQQNNVLEFDEEAHIYKLDGREIPSVTTILTDVGLYPSFEFVKPWYAERGTMTHRACHLLDMGTLLESSVDERIKGFVDSYRTFKDLYKFQLFESELRVFSREYWYAGTLDKTGLMLIKGKMEDVLLDLKCGGPEFGYQFQTAGYAITQKNRYTTRRISVHLDEGGGIPKLVFHDNPSDFNIFLAAVSVHHAKRRK